MTLVKFKPGFAKDFFRDAMLPSNMMGLLDHAFNEQIAKFERNVFFTPRVDVTENQEQFTILMALPGMKKEAINIDVEGDALIVSGEHKVKETKENERTHTIENYYGKFSRVFTLPEHVNKTAILADFEDGMLKITLPKQAEKAAKTKVIIK